MKKILKKIFKNTINSVLSSRYRNYTEFFFESIKTVYPQLVDQLEGQKFMILTPHADDESLGCGGTILKFVQEKKEIMVLLFSDNSDSIINCDPKDAINIRSIEFHSAMKKLGVQDYQELKITPESFTPNQNLIELLKNIIIKVNPDVVFLPSFLDNHHDHRTLNHVFAKSLRGLNINFKMFLYEVWTPIVPNIVINISEFLDQKSEAIKEYKSQLNNINYLDSIIGLNKYRSLTCLKGNGYCEAFFEINQLEYIKLISKY